MNLKTIVRMVAVGLVLVFGLASQATAQTPDGSTPSEEQFCAGLDGALFGLCNAYCEAKDCQEGAGAAPGCKQIRRNFERQTAGLPLICDPCVRTCTWESIACTTAAAEEYQQCIDSDEAPWICDLELKRDTQNCKVKDAKCRFACERQ